MTQGHSRCALVTMKTLTWLMCPRQVFLGGLLIGGAEELQAALSDGSFKDALDGSNEPALPADLREAVDRTLAQQPAVIFEAAAVGFIAFWSRRQQED